MKGVDFDHTHGVIDDYTIEFKMSRPWTDKYPPADWTPILPKRREHAFKLQEIMAEDLPCAVLARPEVIGQGHYKSVRLFKSQSSSVLTQL